MATGKAAPEPPEAPEGDELVHKRGLEAVRGPKAQVIALLGTVLEDIENYSANRTTEKRQQIVRALRWVESPCEDAWSFEWCCDELSWDVQAVRQALLDKLRRAIRTRPKRRLENGRRTGQRWRLNSGSCAGVRAVSETRARRRRR